MTNNNRFKIQSPLKTFRPATGKKEGAKQTPSCKSKKQDQTVRLIISAHGRNRRRQPGSQRQLW